MRVVDDERHGHRCNCFNCGDDDCRPINFPFHKSLVRTNKKAHIHLRGIWAKKKPLSGRLFGAVDEMGSTGKTLHQVKQIGRTQSPHPSGELCGYVQFCTTKILLAGGNSVMLKVTMEK